MDRSARVIDNAIRMISFADEDPSEADTAADEDLCICGGKQGQDTLMFSI